MPKTKTPFRSRRSKKRQNRRHILVSTLVTAVVVSMVVALGYVTRLPGFSITDIRVEGGETVSHDLVEKRANDVLIGTYALVIPKRFVYLYPHDKVVAAIKSIQRVKDAQVTRSQKNELSISFSEYLPSALWCESVSTSSTTPSSCLFVDEYGYAFTDAPELKGGALVRYVTEAKVPVVNEFVLPQSTLEIFKKFRAALAERHSMRIHAVTLTKDNDIIFNLNTGADILVSKDADMQIVFDNLESILSSEEFSDLAPGDFDYIDLRFGNKIYVKEEKDLPAEEDEGSTTPDISEE